MFGVEGAMPGLTEDQAFAVAAQPVDRHGPSRARATPRVSPKLTEAAVPRHCVAPLAAARREPNSASPQPPRARPPPAGPPWRG